MVNATATQSVTVCKANNSVIDLNVTSQVASQGGMVTYLINVTNNGNVTLNITVNDTVDTANLTYSSSSPAATYAAPMANWTLYNVTPGETRSIYLNATVNYYPTECQSTSNLVSVQGTPPNGDVVNATATQSVTVCKANATTLQVNQTAYTASQGGMVVYQLNVTNNGNVSLNLTVNDTIATGLTYNASSDSGTNVGQNVNWTVLGLAPGASQLLYMNATVNNYPTECMGTTNTLFVEGTPANGDKVNHTSTMVVTVCKANATTLQVNQTSQVPSQGGMVQYQINVTNNGNVTLNITVNDTIDTALNYSASSPAASFHSDNFANWTGISLAPGATATIYLNATVGHSLAACQSTNNLVNIVGVPANGDPVYASATEAVTVCKANATALQINLTSYVASQGGIVQYQINVTNNGNVSLNLTVNDTIDSALNFSSASDGANHTSNFANWTVLNLAPGATQALYLNATVNNYPTQCQATSNFVSIVGTPANGDQVFANATQAITVCKANVTAIKVDNTATSVPGGIVEWSINVSNTGNVTLSPILVVDTLPSGFSFNATNTTYTLGANNTTVNWTLASLPAGGSAIILLNTSIGNVANGTYYNNISVTGVPPNGDNVSDTTSSPVGVHAPAISVVKSASAASATTGQAITFTVNVTNTGDSINGTLLNLTVSITDRLPSGVAFLSASVNATNTSGNVISWANITTLAPGDSYVLRYSVTSNTVGSYTNLVNVTGVPSISYSVSDTDSVPFSFTSSGGGGGGSGGNGGGSVGGGGSGAGAPTKASANYSVDIGGGSSCQVTITRVMTSGQNLSVLTTTLENVGGSSCNLANFTFADTIPDSFPAINEITFNPAYSSRVGWQVSFNFPTFAGGESKTLTYSVNGWVGSSRAKNFTVYTMTANKKAAVAPTQPTQPTTPSTTEEPSVWIPTKLPDIFGPKPAAPAANGTAPPAAPQGNPLASLVLTGLVVLVVLGGIGGLWLYIKRRKKKGL